MASSIFQVLRKKICCTFHLANSDHFDSLNMLPSGPLINLHCPGQSPRNVRKIGGSMIATLTNLIGYAVSLRLIAFGNGFGNGKELISQPVEAPVVALLYTSRMFFVMRTVRELESGSTAFHVGEIDKIIQNEIKTSKNPKKLMLWTSQWCSHRPGHHPDLFWCRLLNPLPKV